MQKLHIIKSIENGFIINTSDTGAGKTTASIVATRAAKKKLNLVICLNNMSQINNGWAKEISECYPDSHVVIYETKKPINIKPKKYNYVIVNFEKFQQTHSFVELTDIKWDSIIIDEGHKIKRRSDVKASNRRNTILELIDNCRIRNPLIQITTATPVINDFSEPISLIEILSGREYADLKTNISCQNGMAINRRLNMYGIRFIIKDRKNIFGKTISLETHKVYVNTNETYDESINVIERHIKQNSLKLPKILELCKGHKTLIYSHFISHANDRIIYFEIKKYLEDNGLTCSLEETIDDFLNGKTDVLICGRSTSTGIDGLQKIADRIIKVSPSYTFAEDHQLNGRLYRNGSIFDKVEIFELMVQYNNYSKDLEDYNRIDMKKKYHELVADGKVDGRFNYSEQDIKDGISNMVSRISDGIIIPDSYDLPEIETLENIPINKKYNLSEFSEMNRLFNIQTSQTTYSDIRDDNNIWFKYHELYGEARKNWSIDPIDWVVSKIPVFSDLTIADMGCGEERLKEKLFDTKHTIQGFDFYSYSDSVIACDIHDTGEPSSKYDIIVFCLSLMGNDQESYFKEAARILKSKGDLLIVDRAKTWNDGKLKDLLQKENFSVSESFSSDGKWIYIEGTIIK